MSGPLRILSIILGGLLMYGAHLENQYAETANQLRYATTAGIMASNDASSMATVATFMGIFGVCLILAGLFLGKKVESNGIPLRRH